MVGRPDVVVARVAADQSSVNADDNVVGLDEGVRALPLLQLQSFRRVGCDYRYYVDAVGNPNRHFRADWAANEPGNRANKFIAGAELHVTSFCSLYLKILTRGTARGEPGLQCCRKAAIAMYTEI
jgi:hypothetical protein